MSLLKCSLTKGGFMDYEKEDVDYIIHLFKSGNEPNEIAKHMDWSFWTVAEILYKHLGYRCTF
jgi:hypothetical protein